MTQEEKRLLLLDLCTRLPHGVIVSPIDCGKAKLIGFKNDHPILFDLVSQKEYNKPWDIEYIKPYLRPMSSMTDEEWEDFNNYRGVDGILKPLSNDIDWLNKHHFDYRGLIEKGLAIEVTKENNPYETRR
jgi:hypothetical protein